MRHTLKALPQNPNPICIPCSGSALGRGYIDCKENDVKVSRKVVYMDVYICMYIYDYEIPCKYSYACRLTLLKFSLSCAVWLTLWIYIHLYIFTGYLSVYLLATLAFLFSTFLRRCKCDNEKSSKGGTHVYGCACVCVCVKGCQI